MKKFFNFLSLLLATGFGIGYLVPVGQGTLASFFALFFIGPFLDLSYSSQLLFILAGLAAAIFVASVAERYFGKKDDHRIVIDEIISIFITFAGLSGVSIPVLILGFFLNRLFDIWKPLFIKRLQNLPGGWGVMLDDAASGFVAAIVLRLFLLVGDFFW
jgi:phosphatidylglycerophosphatase A